MDPELQRLKQRWLSSGLFEDEQAYLNARAKLAGNRYVFLDPDGTAPPWLIAVVRSETGVIYGTQCGGGVNDQRVVEGYVVPLGGTRFEEHDKLIDLAPLTDAFHSNGACVWEWHGKKIPPDRRDMLRRAVQQIPCWRSSPDARGDGPAALQFDESRMDEIAEAWIPVITPYGAGVLLYKNCD